MTFALTPQTRQRRAARTSPLSISYRPQRTADLPEAAVTLVSTPSPARSDHRGCLVPSGGKVRWDSLWLRI